jgi:predicted ATPase
MKKVNQKGFSSDRLHLKKIQCLSWPERLDNKFPFSLNFWKSTPNLEFHARVTFLVGENGSGKSTFLETIACAAHLVTAGSASVDKDPTLADVRLMGNYIKLIWQKRTHKGFFLRAEDFFWFF